MKERKSADIIPFAARKVFADAAQASRLIFSPGGLFDEEGRKLSGKDINKPKQTPVPWITL